MDQDNTYSTFGFQIMKIEAATLTVEEDWMLGNSHSAEVTGAHKIYLYSGQWLYVSGALFQPEYTSFYPVGSILILDKDDLTSPSTGSPKFNTDFGDPRNRYWPYDFDVSESLNKLVWLVTATWYPEENSSLTQINGRNGDGHAPRNCIFDINSGNGALSGATCRSFADGTVEACDTVSIANNEVFMTCTYINSFKNSRVLPLIARMSLGSLAY